MWPYLVYKYFRKYLFLFHHIHLFYLIIKNQVVYLFLTIVMFKTGYWSVIYQLHSNAPNQLLPRLFWNPALVK